MTYFITTQLETKIQTATTDISFKCRWRRLYLQRCD